MVHLPLDNVGVECLCFNEVHVQNGGEAVRIFTS